MSGGGGPRRMSGGGGGPADRPFRPPLLCYSRPAYNSRPLYAIPTLYYVIPSIAEESKMYADNPISRLLDSSAMLGMT